MQPAGFGARIVARFADGFLISIVVGLVAAVAGLDDSQRTALTIVTGVTYETIAIARWQRTVGKTLTKLRVVDVAGGAAAPWQALARTVVVLGPTYAIAPRTDTIGEWLVVAFLVANFVVVAMRREDRRGIHDLLARTRPVAVATSS